VLTLSIIPANADLLKSDNTPVKHFGFATGPEVETLTEVNRYYDITRSVLGTGAIIRTGLTWEPSKEDVPGFEKWSSTMLQPALARGLTVLPGIRTRGNLGGYSMPTDAQWAHGLRQIVRMYGPGGVYARGGTYVKNGRTIRVAAHPGFKGLRDYELWNEPNSNGNLNGNMTPAMAARLLRVGSQAMRDEARRLGFNINIIGPAIGGLDLEYLSNLWQADNQLFRHIDTISFHNYMRLPPWDCNPQGASKRRCVKTLLLIRNFMDTHGGAHVHLGTTEGGYSGDTGNCRGPQVLTEQQQADYTEAALRWYREHPGLDLDFWITYHAIDQTVNYSFPCNSGRFDEHYRKGKLGVVRADLSIKPVGVRFRALLDAWR
jgi:hypothetical protein